MIFDVLPVSKPILFYLTSRSEKIDKWCKKGPKIVWTKCLRNVIILLERYFIVYDYTKI